MSAPLLHTKLYIPPLRPKAVHRPRLIERINEGLHRKLTLIIAAAGSGKTSLVSEWIAVNEYKRPVAWLSLDERDHDPARFLTYLCAALQTVGASIGEGVYEALRAPQLPSIESILTILLNEITAIPHDFVLVLDDYHAVQSHSVDLALIFLLEHMPQQMHLMITTREEPQVPLSRMRVRSQLTELRTMDLRFTRSEATEFLVQVMRLTISSEEIALLESRTEGWIAGLQLAALSIQDHDDKLSFIQSFTGSHRFVLDYLVEEVLQRQSEAIQQFLLRTSILDRMCAPLCDAIVAGGEGEVYLPAVASQPVSSQAILEFLEQASLFIIPLDNERRWYRYHHLFADLLRQRMNESSAVLGKEGALPEVNVLHIRASEWYEASGSEGDAFHHAAAAQDIERAARLVEGGGMPLIFRGEVTPIMCWLKALPREELDRRPSLWVLYASALLLVGQLAGVEPKLQAAEKVLQDVKQDEGQIKDLIGHIASIRATLAVSKHQAEKIITESQRALDNLSSDNLPVRAATVWALGYAYQLQQDRAAARKAYSEARFISQSIGHVVITMMSTLGLGNIEEAENQLYEAAETYRHVLQLAGNPPYAAACEAYLGLARIYLEWNDLDTAESHVQQAIQLAKQLELTDRAVASEVVLAQLQLARGEIGGAAARLREANRSAHEQGFETLLPEMTSTQVLILLGQGDVEAAAELTEQYKHPISQARVLLAKGDTSNAWLVLEAWRAHAEALSEEERLQITVLQAAVLYARGDKIQAVQKLNAALTIAEPASCVRLFVDEGRYMYALLREAVLEENMQDYIVMLLRAFPAEGINKEVSPVTRLATSESLVEPLSERELEILELIAQGLSNHEICERLFLALSTVKGYNRTMFDKLQVKRRTEAVAYARKLGLI